MKRNVLADDEGDEKKSELVRLTKWKDRRASMKQKSNAKKRMEKGRRWAATHVVVVVVVHSLVYIADCVCIVQR